MKNSFSEHSIDWTNTRVYDLFKMRDKYKHIKQLFIAEEKGIIPKPERIPRGKVQVRRWTTAQLPEIGKVFGFLSQPYKKQIICVYSTKGGVLKTSFTYNAARILALNGIRTLMVGLDTIQESLSDLALNPQAATSLDELNKEVPGLYHYFFERANLADIIKKTSLPTLDIIPENPELAQLELKISSINRREYFFLENLIDNLDYDVIIFDNGAGFTKLVENSLAASNIVICPLGCTQLAYKAINKNMSLVHNYQKIMRLNWEHFIQIPTLLSRKGLSEMIYSDYIKKYSKTIIPIPIRDFAKGEDANLLNVSAIEYAPRSSMASDYYNLISALWDRINHKVES